MRERMRRGREEDRRGPGVQLRAQAEAGTRQGGPALDDDSSGSVSVRASRVFRCFSRQSFESVANRIFDIVVWKIENESMVFFVCGTEFGKFRI